VETLLIRRPEELDELAESWNAAPASRGLQADPYDSQAWIRAWAGADPAGRERFVCPAVVDGGRVVAALPMVAGGRLWRPAGCGWRPRYRLVCQGERPDPDVLGRLVETALRAGAKRLELTAMPDRDPATGLLGEALSRSGCVVDCRRGSVECLAEVHGGWEEHRRRFRKYARTVNNFSNKAARLGAVELDEHAAGRSELQESAWRAYAHLHARGWKGELGEAMRRHRQDLFSRLVRLGWLRLFTLSVAGVPAAAIVWMRAGRVAVAYSTVYDVQLAALSAGTILMWRAHEQLAREAPVGLFDYLPGRGPQKDQLGVDRSPLITLDVRRRSLFGLSGARAVRRVRGLAGSLRRRLGPPARRTAKRPAAAKETIAGTYERPDEPQRVACAEVPEGAARDLYLAVAGGHPSAKQMKRHWGDDDRWWQVGEPAAALVRVGPVATEVPAVREVVLVDGGGEPAELLRNLAGRLGRSLETRPHPSSPGPIPVHRAPLPLPDRLTLDRADPAKS
jgi:CelD/BcsL family acetyltransferase involved in cellulose biosynthesis